MHQSFFLFFTQALYAHYEMMNNFDSIQGHLKEKLIDLVQAMGETKFDLEAAIGALKKKDVALEKMSKAKTEVDEVVVVLKVELRALQK